MLVKRVLKRLLARSAGGGRSAWPKLLIALIVLAALPALAYWRGFGLEGSGLSQNASEMVVERIDRGTDRNSERLNLVLKEKSGPRRLVLAVGPAEALSIVNDVNSLGMGGPIVSAYALSSQIAGALGGKIQRLVVNDATDKAFFTKVVLVTENREVTIDASTGDAIALALRSKVPIFADNSVLDKAGIVSGR